MRAGDHREALSQLNPLVEHDARDARSLFLRGACFDVLGDPAAAYADFAHASTLDPGNVQILQAKAAALARLGHLEEAGAVLLGLLAQHPRDGQVHTNLAVLLEQQGRDAQALESYRKALEVAPTTPDALKNRALLLARLGRKFEAVAAAAAFRDAYPESAEAHFILGEAYAAPQADYDAAALSYGAAIECDPRQFLSRERHGIALAMLGRFAPAQQALDAAERIDPAGMATIRRQVYGTSAQANERLDARAVYVLARYERLENCDWVGHDAFVSAFTDLARDPKGPHDRSLAFRAMTLGLPLDAQFALARRVAERVAQRAASVLGPRLESRARAKRKLRVGYVSPEFGNHALAHLTKRLFSLHDRSAVEVYGYALIADDRGPARRAVRTGCDVFRDVSDRDAAATAAAIHGDAIDVLVDMGGYTTASHPEIFHLRPAPLQLSYLSYLATLGGGAIDYLIADDTTVPPGHARFYSEAIAYLPGCSFIYDDRQPIAEAPASRSANGLPENRTVLCAFHNGYKIEPGIFSVWMRLLQRSDAVLWLLQGSPDMARNLLDAARRSGVEAGRLVFAPRLETSLHLARTRLADLFLDTPSCNGGATVSDALYAGVPVLTTPGPGGIAARMGASLVAAAGQSEMIEQDLQGYEKRATQLLAEPAMLGTLRERLRESRHNSLLFDTEKQVRNLEQLYRVVWERCARGELPAAVSLPADA